MIDRLYRWWARDYPPLDGRLRAACYLLLLLLAWDDLFPDTFTRLAQLCPPGLFRPPGLMGLIFGSRSLADVESLLVAIRYPLVLAWIGAALGFLGRAPLALTGIGVLLVWGGQQSCSGTSHTWHLPLYVLLTLGVLITPDRWSLDWYLARRFPRYRFRPGHDGAGDASSFARKLCLVLAVFTLFAAGATKLWQAGPAWMDGRPLAYYLSEMGDPKWPVGTRLQGLIEAVPILLPFLAVGTMTLELGSVATLFVPRLRWPFVLGAWAFHLGIWLLMLPRYFPQMACYVLLVDWRLIQLRQPGRTVRALLGLVPPPARDDPANPLPAWRGRLGVVLTGGAVTLLLVGTLLRQREYWPLSHIPMYSSYVSPERVGRFARSDFESVAGLARVAQHGVPETLPWASRALLAPRIRLARAGATCVRVLHQGFPYPLVERLLWDRRVTIALLNDLRAGGGAGPPAHFPEVERVLSTVRDRVMAQEAWQETDRFVLVFVEADGSYRPLAALDRQPGAQPPPGREEPCSPGA